MSENCLFCQIGKKETNAYVVYDDERSMAFLDAYPVSEGHTLIIPKAHYENICDIPQDLLAHVMKKAKELVKRYQEIFHPVGFNLIQSNGKAAQQTVFHFHLHIIPRYENDGLRLFRHHFLKADMNLVESYQKILRYHQKIEEF